MAGEVEGAVADVTYDNVVLANFLPFTVVDVDPTNSTATVTAAMYNAGAFPSECLGVVYDQSKLDPLGNPVKNSGVNVRHWGIARIAAIGAIAAGAYVSVGNAAGQIQAQAQAGAGVVPKPIVGRALTPAAGAGDRILVLLMIGSRY